MDEDNEETDKLVRMIAEIVDHEHPKATADEIYEIIHGEAGLINELTSAIYKKHSSLRKNSKEKEGNE